MTKTEGNRPSIFVLGAQKCGTTTVADLLSEQPEIFVPSIKETYYFCDEELHARGDSWYEEEFFASRVIEKGKSQCCDATPFYLASKTAIDRLSDYVDDSSRFIVCLRDPIKRAYSAYWHQRRLGNELLTFQEALETESERVNCAVSAKGRWWRHAYTEVGQYGSQLEYAFERLGRERFMVLSEQSLADTDKLQRQLRAFLGLPPSSRSAVVLKANRSAMPRSRVLQKMVTGRNPLKRLVQRIIPRELRTRLGRRLLSVNQKSFEYAPMTPVAESYLRTRFEPELAKLRVLAIDVPASWQAKS